MFERSLKILLPVAMVLACAVFSSAQVKPENRDSVIPKQSESENDDRPKSFRETLVKLRIDREKKDYGEMLERAEEAVTISIELEEAFERNGKLSSAEFNSLATVEKLVKKIRNELGGDDDGDNKDSVIRSIQLSLGDAIKTFKSATSDLLDELKKTSRFTVSAAAIQTSNAVLKITRFLRITN